MAILSEAQMKRRMERDKKQYDLIKKKTEIQRKKTVLGKDWEKKEVERQKEELKEVTGDVNPVLLLDVFDINAYFPPVNLFRDENGKVLQADFQNYAEAEKKYKKQLSLYDKEQQMLLWEQAQDEYLISGDINDKPLPKEMKDFTEEDIKKWEDNGYYGVNNELGDVDKKNIIVPGGEDKYLKKGAKASPTPFDAIRENIFFNIAMHFGRFVPIYNKKICNCCGKPLKLNEYYINFGVNNAANFDCNGNLHMGICKTCCKRLFEFYYFTKAEKNAETAMKMFCSATNTYWDVDLFYSATKIMEDEDGRTHIVEEYIRKVNTTDIGRGKTFLDSPFLNEKYESKVVVQDTPNLLVGWSKEDTRNRKQVIRMVGYDPFSYEKEENQKMLYKDLLGMLEQGMEQDQVKLQAAIQIVVSFLKVREMNEEYRRKQNANAGVNELKALADLKAKELKSITDFSRDNGFSERFATAKAKGENTFTGIMNKMNEQKYEDALLNKYNIETSETIQQAANASFKAIFNQLSLGDSDVWKIAQEQLQELLKLRKENGKLQEEIRLVKYDLAKANLEARAKEQGIRVDEVDSDIEDEER